MPAASPQKSEQKILEDNQLTRPIVQEVTEKIENLIKVFGKEAKMTRPYCNEVTVKVSRSLLNHNSRKRVEYVEQVFKITNDTSF